MLVVQKVRSSAPLGLSALARLGPRRPLGRASSCAGVTTERICREAGDLPRRMGG